MFLIIKRILIEFLSVNSSEVGQEWIINFSKCILGQIKVMTSHELMMMMIIRGY